jgi:hypothetical protein
MLVTSRIPAQRNDIIPAMHVTAIALSQVRGFIAFVLVFIVFWAKLRREEEWMRSRFGETYAHLSPRQSSSYQQPRGSVRVMMVSIIGQGRELFSPWCPATKAFASLSARHTTPVLSMHNILAEANLTTVLKQL